MLILDGGYMDIFIGTFIYFFSMSFSERKGKKGKERKTRNNQFVFSGGPTAKKYIILYYLNLS